MKICKSCGKEFEVDSRTKRKKFCNLSCSATYNNENKGSLSEEHKLNISNSLKQKWDKSPEVFSSGEKHSKTVGKATRGKFNNKEVKSILEYSTRTVQKIMKRLDLACSNCGWDNTTCDIHHINGRKIDDCDNHNNLSLLCPNCHRLVHEGKLDNSELKTLNETIPDNWRDYYYG